MNKILTALVAAPIHPRTTHFHPLYAEAVRAYHLLSVLRTRDIHEMTGGMVRLTRLTKKAHERAMRRMINLPCDVCGRPATRHTDDGPRCAAHAPTDEVQP